ncbi:MAG TPA: streptomycin biosynthesis protein [Amycolatopsis sp.]|uniref:streptomycin biosynthesis protein n=1 Tax=Amycolatopsis sp. TaxID=37632 RepID=UPI002B45E912|nr:streptomycin biosynthesis protein [Amycolatopsis sp.]HKS50134.1 streptomycin biosynthesis protein [Amycolatopsis sp.]
MLAQSDAELPPILVHRATMRVVDGMHRLLAARMRGQQEIAVRFVDGSEDAIFVLAVKANVQHGLPLSLADREAAAARIVAAYPEWSDRAVATATGIAAKTVRAIRLRSSEHLPQSNIRIGRDGRARPIDGAEGRRRAVEVIARRPHASLREIAREARISLGTAHNVRSRLAANQDPLCGKTRVPEGTPAAQEREVPQPPPDEREPARQQTEDEHVGAPDWATVRQLLRKDPALKYSESGRALLRWLDVHAIEPEEWKHLLSAVPSHWGDVIVAVALRRAEQWRRFAAELR